MLDTTLPKILEKSRTNYIEGSTLVEAEEAEQADDHARLGASLTLALNSLAVRLSERNLDAFSQPTDATSPKTITRTKLTATFDPIARAPKTPLVPQKGPYISSFDGPTSIITEDLAPYVRTIVSSDIKIEEQRTRLNALLSQGGPHKVRKARTTRASLAALEGGSKAHTRRKRWFSGTTDSFFAPVLQSGGDEWQEVAWQRALEEHGEETASSEQLQTPSRRSSVSSLDELQ